MNLLKARFIVSAICIVTLFWGGPLHAKKSKKKRKASLSFEDELVRGDLKGSELLYFLRRREVNYKKLIKLRENFLPEMRRSAEEIRRGKGK